MHVSLYTPEMRENTHEETTKVSIIVKERQKKKTDKSEHIISAPKAGTAHVIN